MWLDSISTRGWEVISEAKEAGFPISMVDDAPIVDPGAPYELLVRIFENTDAVVLALTYGAGDPH